MTLAANLQCSPFEIFDQDTDEVIMVINFYIELGFSESEKPKAPVRMAKERRIRVNDKTATGGWF